MTILLAFAVVAVVFLVVYIACRTDDRTYERMAEDNKHFGDGQ